MSLWYAESEKYKSENKEEEAKEAYTKGYEVGSKAVWQPPNPDDLFVETRYYDYLFGFDFALLASCLGRFAEALNANQKVLAGISDPTVSIPPIIVAKLRQNNSWYQSQVDRQATRAAAAAAVSSSPLVLVASASSASPTTNGADTKERKNTSEVKTMAMMVGGGGPQVRAEHDSTFGIRSSDCVALDSQVSKCRKLPVGRLACASRVTTQLIVDDFLREPQKLRDMALSNDFATRGNFAGSRSRSYWSEELRFLFERILGGHKSIVSLPEARSGAFQLTLSSETDAKNVFSVHREDYDWCAILFLSPDPPASSGITFYRHFSGATIENADNRAQLLRDRENEAAWETTDVIANKFNRLVIFNPRQSHRATAAFGTSRTTARLIQLFLFNTS